MLTKTVQLDNCQFTAHELTLKEVRTWYEGFAQGGPCDLVDELAAPGISLPDLAINYRCDAGAFEDLSARELELLVQAARETNPHFFRARDMVASVVEAMIAKTETILNGIPKRDEVA